MTKTAQRNLDRINKRIDRIDGNAFARLASIYAASRKQAQHLLHASGQLSIVEWRTLWDLYEAGDMTIGDLAASQRTDQSQLSRALPDMQRKGLVSMGRAAQDGRQTIVSLTQAGRDAYDLAAPIMARRRAALRSEFSEEELQTFLDLLGRFEEFVRLPAEEIAARDPAE